MPQKHAIKLESFRFQWNQNTSSQLFGLDRQLR